MEPTAAVPLPPQVGQVLDFGIMIFEFLLLCGLIERAVAVCKHLTKLEWKRPWVLIAFVFCWASCTSYRIDLIYAIYKIEPGPVLIFIPGSLFGVLISALAATGGGAGIVEAVNTALRRREEVHVEKVEQMRRGTTTTSTDIVKIGETKTEAAP